MPRLRFSQGAMRRVLLLTGARFTIFVEGSLDQAFFNFLFSECAICDIACVTTRLAREINPEFGSGKTALLEQHRNLSESNSLVVEGISGRHLSVFFIDKDLDDVFGLMRNCRHVIYTEHYSMENYLYLHGDLKLALCCGVGLDLNAVASLANNDVWAAHASGSWREWIALCLLMRHADSSFGPNYSAKRSMINDAQSGALLPTEETAIIAQLSTRAGIAESELRQRYARFQHEVDEAISARTVDRIFNGKWYLPFLTNDALRLAAGRGLASGFPDRMESVLLSSLEFSEDWAGALRNNLLRVCSN